MASLPMKRRAGEVWRLVHRGGVRRVVLLFHSVDGGPWSVGGEVFRKQMKWLSGAARVVPIDALLDGEPRERLAVALTFDDGYTSVARGAAQVLENLGFPATVYVNSGWIGEAEHRASDPARGHYPGETFMTWNDLAHLQANGWTIGAHGVDHIDLVSASAHRRESELRGSKAMIEAHLGGRCDHFAYTWGRYSRETQAAVARAGFRTAASAIHSPVGRDADRFALPRIDVPWSYTVDDFKAVVLGDWDYLRWVQQGRRVVERIRRSRP